MPKGIIMVKPSDTFTDQKQDIGGGGEHQIKLSSSLS